MLPQKGQLGLAAAQLRLGLGDVLLARACDNQGLRLIASVHFGTDFNNALWNGRQMIFGDGDGVPRSLERDGDPTSFSASELSSINEVWTRVAEDFAPFNVNVVP